MDVLHNLQFPDRRNDPLQRFVKNRIARRVDHHAEQCKYSDDIDNVVFPGKPFGKHHNTKNQQQRNPSYVCIVEIVLKHYRQDPAKQYDVNNGKQKDKEQNFGIFLHVPYSPLFNNNTLLPNCSHLVIRIAG
ncbi:hypothetical protein D3C80_1368080 [compost metagenome]